MLMRKMPRLGVGPFRFTLGDLMGSLALGILIAFTLRGQEGKNTWFGPKGVMNP